MMNDELDFNNLDDFLHEDLFGQELLDFEDKLLDDLDLRDELDLHVDINSAILEDDIMDLRAKLQNIEIPKKDIEKRKLLFLNKWSLIAASITLLIGISSVLFINNNNKSSNSNLFSNYYKPYNVVNNTRSEAKTGKLELNSALKYYKAKDYQNALILFKRILDKDSLNIASNFYSGISNIELDKLNGANKNFTRVIKHKNNLFLEQSEWYLGLVYLQNKDTGKALKQFHLIANSNSFYKSKALEIVNQIE